jgi:hypothetical protein
MVSLGIALWALTLMLWVGRAAPLRTSSTGAEYSPTRKLSTHLQSTKQESEISWLGFAQRKYWEILTITNMLNLYTICAGRLAICTKVDLKNQLALVLLQGRQLSAWLIWRVASCRGGRREAKSQSAKSPPEWGTNPSTSPYYSVALETKLISTYEYSEQLLSLSSQVVCRSQ